MSAQLVTEITILVLAAFVGFEVISKVPTLLHTPLMSGTNAIHGIVIVGAIIVMGTPHPGLFMRILSFIAVVLASANVVGGFVVTDRMLEMFKKRPDEASSEHAPQRNLLYLVHDRGVHPRAALPLVAPPRAARRPDRRGRDALGGRSSRSRSSEVVTGYWLMAAGMAIGSAIGSSARGVKMTAMPQMVALFNGVGGGAAALIVARRVPHGLGAQRRRRRRARSRDGLLGAHRLDLLRRLPDRLRQAAGADQRAADHVPGPAGRERAPLRRLDRPRGRGDGDGQLVAARGGDPRSLPCSASCSSSRSAAPTCRS